MFCHQILVLIRYLFSSEASVLLKILRGHWKAYLIEKPSLELCRHLVMLRDYNISGRINLMEIPVLLHMLHFWKVSCLHHFIDPKLFKAFLFYVCLIHKSTGDSFVNISSPSCSPHSRHTIATTLFLHSYAMLVPPTR